MKRIILLLVAAVLSISFAPVTQTSAVDIITDAQIESIRTHCTDIQGSLNRLNQADTLLRYNRGQLYLLVANKLMSPLNQRIASNQLDGSELVKITANYKSAYKRFFNAYKEYDVTLADAQAIDCTKQPTTFYDKLSEASDKRLALHAANAEIVQLANQYQDKFNEFSANTVAAQLEQKQ